MNESRIVLESLFTRLSQCDVSDVGRVVLDDDSISALDGKVTLTVDVQHDPDWHPSIAHGHVFAWLGTDRKSPLEACVVGIDPDRAAGLRDCGKYWMEMVAGPIFSLLHAKPVMGAIHFDGPENGGFANGHGFLGPIGVRLTETPLSGDALERIASFEGAAELSPPEVVHLAKVVMQATEHGWRRTLEINGHRAVFADRPRIDGVPSLLQGVFTRFAVYSFADRMEGLEARRRIDGAIRKFVEHFGNKGTSDAAAMALLAEGIDIELVKCVYAFSPLAFGRVMFESVGVQWSPYHSTIDAKGTRLDQLQLMSEPVFARSMVIGAELLQSAHGSSLKQLALTSAETHALNNALNAGLAPREISATAPIVSYQAEGGLPVVEVVFHRKNDPSSASNESRGSIAKKPWWRIWR